MDELNDLIAQGQILARIDDTDYISVHLVFAWQGDSGPTPYCLHADWPETLPAKLAAALRDNNELAEAFSLQAAEALKQAQRAAAAEARVAELERIIEETPIVPPAVAAAATGMPSERKGAYAPPSDGGRSKRIECAICKGLIWPKLFDAHMQRHTRIDIQTAAPEPPAWACEACGATDGQSVTEPARCKACVRKKKPPVHLTPDDPAWRCAESGCSGAFTRSLTSPEYCVKHAPITNGHLAAA